MQSTKAVPDPIQLPTAQRDALQPYLKEFKAYSKTTEFERDQEARHSRLYFFQAEFRVGELAESDLTELISHLWAAQIWGNKQYLVQKIVSANGMEKLKTELTRLWDTSLPVADRYDHFLQTIRYLGPAAITEIMCCLEPERCGIWNQKARTALKILGFDSFVNPNKYRISGAEYGMFNRLLASVAGEIEKLGLSATALGRTPSRGLKMVDLLIVDYFLYNVAQSGTVEHRAAGLPLSAEHDEIRDMIEVIGAMLGFDTGVEVLIAHGATVDVVWRAPIGNLGVVTYVFEVQKGGSIDSLILNPQKAKNSPTVQKVIAVSDDDQLLKIERETQGLQAEFRNALAFWKIADVQQVSQNLQAAMEIINKLGLVPGKAD
jgi:hypothetical protein